MSLDAVFISSRKKKPVFKSLFKLFAIKTLSFLFLDVKTLCRDNFGFINGVGFTTLALQHFLDSTVTQHITLVITVAVGSPHYQRLLT